jgi:hypothetical protein
MSSNGGSTSNLRLVDGYQLQLRAITDNPPLTMSNEGVDAWLDHIKRLRRIILRMGYLPIETQGTLSAENFANAVRVRNKRLAALKEKSDQIALEIEAAKRENYATR